MEQKSIHSYLLKSSFSFIHFGNFQLIPFSGLLVRLTSASSVNRVNFHSIQKQFNAPEWVTLIDLEDAEEHSDTDKIILLDCTKTPLLNSLAILTNDSTLVAVLCVCIEVTEQELKISAEELMSGQYPPILFLQDKATDVAELKQLLLLNPQEVECSICEEQTPFLIPLQDSACKCLLSLVLKQVVLIVFA